MSLKTTLANDPYRFEKLSVRKIKAAVESAHPFASAFGRYDQHRIGAESPLDFFYELFVGQGEAVEDQTVS